MGNLIKDTEFGKAVSSIKSRSEREMDTTKLSRSFVDSGILIQLSNTNNQILYGRKGTGKTHVLKVLQERLTDPKYFLVVYIDLRTIGSNTQSNTHQTAADSGVILFKDILSHIHDALMDRVKEYDREVTKEGWSAIDELSQLILNVSSIRIEETITDRTKTMAEANKESSFGFDIKKDPGLSFSKEHSDTQQAELEQTRTYKISPQQHLIFSQVHRVIEEAIKGQNLKQVYILIDEWTAIDTEVQPFLAEFIKRTIFPNPLITIKIASLEYRSRFSIGIENNNVIGFELGADVSARLELDDYYVFDRNPSGVRALFGELLFKHITAELPNQYLPKIHRIHNSQQLATALFTEAATFDELVRAAEGVARDFISIFSLAFFQSWQKGRRDIDVSAITEAALEWYERDKAPLLTINQQRVLSNILNSVIGKKKARSFLIAQSESRHTIIQSLFDYRVLHLIKKGYSEHKKPGLRYDIYTLDYGTYVGLRRSTKTSEFELDLVDGAPNSPERVVPFDDNRSIRRIILTAAELDAWLKGS